MANDSPKHPVTPAVVAQPEQEGPDAKELRQVTREDAKEERDLVRAKLELLFETVTDTRKLEIGLFWQRALFFWGFIASAFVGYATLNRYGSRRLALAVACFGFVCSFAWSLANRGSKYWQENWEARAKNLDVAVLGKAVFGVPEKEPTGLGWWLRPRRFSVSRLATALSDFTVLMWFALMVGTAISTVPNDAPTDSWLRSVGTFTHGSLVPFMRDWLWLAAPVITSTFTATMVYCSRTRPWERTTEGLTAETAPDNQFGQG